MASFGSNLEKKNIQSDGSLSIAVLFWSMFCKNPSATTTTNVSATAVKLTESLSFSVMLTNVSCAGHLELRLVLVRQNHRRMVAFKCHHHNLKHWKKTLTYLLVKKNKNLTNQWMDFNKTINNHNNHNNKIFYFRVPFKNPRSPYKITFKNNS